MNNAIHSILKTLFLNSIFGVILLHAEGDKQAEEAKVQTVPEAGKTWTNSLGLEFVPVPGTPVLFCKWNTRIKDFELFAKETAYPDFEIGMAGMGKGPWRHPHPGIGPTCPMTACWLDFKAFCKWLTEKERKGGLIGMNQEYRLPFDWEWSVAAGLKEPREGSPQSKSDKLMLGCEIMTGNRGSLISRSSPGRSDRDPLAM